MRSKYRILSPSICNVRTLFKVSGLALVAPIASVALASPFWSPDDTKTPIDSSKVCRVADKALTNNPSLNIEGKYWDTAFTSLGKALSTARCKEVWIKQGTYDTSLWHDDDGVTIQAGTTVWGGFYGNDAQDNLYKQSPSATILDGDRYAYHTVTLKGDVQRDTVISNLTISGGQADGSSSKDYDKGGGLYCSGDSTQACSPTIIDVYFERNEANAEGGAVYMTSRKDVSPLFSGSTRFWKNESGGNGGALAIRSGLGSNAQPEIEHARFYGNTADEKGGAIYTYAFASPVFTKISHTEFTNNQAASGSAIFQQHFSFLGNSHNHTELSFSSVDGSAFTAPIRGSSKTVTSITSSYSYFNTPFGSTPLSQFHTLNINATFTP